MEELILTLKRGPHGLLRVGIGDTEAVYLPVEPDIFKIHRNGQPVWSNDMVTLFVTAYRDHVEIKLLLGRPGKRASEEAARAP